MADQLDGAIAEMLARVLERFADQISSEAAIRVSADGWGLPPADTDALVAYLGARGPAVSGLSTSLPAITAQLRSSSPDLGALIRPVTGLWNSVSALVDQAPAVSIPELPDAGSLLNVLLGQAVDLTLRDLSPLGWAFARSIRLVEPGIPIMQSLGGLVEAPSAFLWLRFKSLRRNIDITLAGVLTGVRMTSLITTAADNDTNIPPDALAKLPAASVVLGRVTLRLAADTFDEPVPITFEVLGDAADPPGFVAVVVRTPAWLSPMDLGKHLRVSLDPLTTPLGVALTGYGDLVPLTAGQPRLSLESSFSVDGWRFGSPGGLQLTFAEPVLGIDLGASSWGATFGMGRFELVIPQNVAGPVIGVLLPSGGVTLRGKLVAAIDSDGIHLQGGVGLTATWPDTIRLPGLVIRDLKTEISVGDVIGVAAYGTVVVALGPVVVAIEGIGIAQSLELTADGSGNLGIVDLPAPRLRPPAGVGVHVDAVILRGGGFLRIEGDEISGALELILTLGSLQLSVRAVAVIGNVDGAVSFIIIIGIEFSPAIEIFLGLTLNAIGGIFGLNRTLDPTALGDLARSGRMNDIMFPDDLSARAIEIIASVKRVFPPNRGQFVVGPMLKLGWGRPVSFVTLSVGVVFTFPKPVMVAIVGNLHLALPAHDIALVNLNCSFAGGIDFDNGDVWFDASLERSTIGMFDVSGDLCLRAGSRGFVFSAGGFHPKFPLPRGIPQLRRLAISMNPSPILKIRAEAYFAVTSSTLQFGARLFLSAELGPIGAKGNLGLDVLFQTEPHFHFTAELSGCFALTFEGEEICGADIDVLLEGPGLWRARAHASIRILFIKVSGSIDLTWGEDAHESRPAIDVAERVRAALTQDQVWAHIVPAADAGSVQLRQGAVGLHPLGSLRLTQTVAPLDVPLQKYGANPVASADPIRMTVTATGAGTPAPQTELFAPAQFFQMTDDEKLSKPQFVPFQAGFTIAGDSRLPAADPLTVDVIYEEATSEGRDPVGFRWYATLGADALGWTITGAAVRGRERAVDPPPIRGIRLEEPAFAVADASSGRFLATASNPLSASMARSADRVLLAPYESVGVL